jgi:FtsP/CotA-like multicopper oxidase with cupredoxin domain
MYYNVFGEKVSRRRFKEMCDAANNRRELIAHGLTSRRDLFKMGLLTAGGMLVAKSGLSARAQVSPQSPTPGTPGSNVKTNNPPSAGNNTSPGTNQNCVPGNQTASPQTKPFIQPLPIMPVAKPVSSLSPAPTLNPNVAAGEVRAAAFQAPQINSSAFPVVPGTLYQMNQRQFVHSFTPQLNSQTIWGFDDNSGRGTQSPGYTYQAFYGKPQLTRNINSLPATTQVNNTGFGVPQVTTHLHNAHNPSESDGNPCDFYPAGNFCDQYYPNVLAGFNSTNINTNGDINEALSTLWYHDHRVDFTSQNTYKGLLGFYCLFNQFDTGDETTGFRLPSFPNFDIPLAFADKVFDPNSGDLVFDLFNLDGILGDKFIVNGAEKPFLVVSPRRYRFRLLDTGPSRFYEFFLTGNISNQGSPTTNPFFLIGTDGNLIPAPVQVNSVRIGPAERVDVVIDFTNFAGQTLYLENRLLQFNGQGPAAVDSLTGTPSFFGSNGSQDGPSTECDVVLASPSAPIKVAGTGDLILQFQVTGPKVKDNSLPPSKQTFYQLPTTTPTPRIVRTFKFDRLNGQWSINGQFMDCGYGNGGTGGESTETFRFTVQQNSVEHWLLTNLTGDWTHPVHIHLEEHQILSRNRMVLNSANPLTVPTDQGRKDVTQLHPNERVELFFRFRDWLGKYPIHCHNVVHEDHAMMALWHVQPTGDNILVP